MLAVLSILARCHQRLSGRARQPGLNYLSHESIADCSLPARLSWTSLLAQHDSCMATPSLLLQTRQPSARCSLCVARSHRVEQLSQQTSSKASMYRSIKIGYALLAIYPADQQQASETHPSSVPHRVTLAQHRDWPPEETR